MSTNWRPLDGPDGPHRPSMVLEMVGTPPSFGEFCLSCQKPWPCPGAAEAVSA